MANLLFTSYVGGSSDDWGRGFCRAGRIGMDSWLYQLPRLLNKEFFSGNACWWSRRFPQRLSSYGKVLFSTYSGGQGSDFGAAVPSDTEGNAYLCRPNRSNIEVYVHQLTA